MRKLLFFALFLYDIVLANRISYDYDDIDNSKRHSFIDDRRNWRKKALLKSYDQDPKEWDERLRYEDSPRYQADIDDRPGFSRKEYDSTGFGSGKHLEDDKARYRSTEIGYLQTDKELERKPYSMNCERPHERYEACFSGCAAITCDNPRERLRPCYPFCEPGCICIQPYVRDDRTHKCVLPEECTKGLKGIPDLGDDV